MKEVIWKSKPYSLKTYRANLSLIKILFEENWVKNKFNNFFFNIGRSLANYIPTATKSFESYVQKANETI